MCVLVCVDYKGVSFAANIASVFATYILPCCVLHIACLFLIDLFFFSDLHYIPFKSTVFLKQIKSIMENGAHTGITQ